MKFNKGMCKVLYLEWNNPRQQLQGSSSLTRKRFVNKSQQCALKVIQILGYSQQVEGSNFSLLLGSCEITHGASCPVLCFSVLEKQSCSTGHMRKNWENWICSWGQRRILLLSREDITMMKPDAPYWCTGIGQEATGTAWNSGNSGSK